jgi:ABC-type nitrate/sulfonate/bicarbonate transport system substrate-binding protein
MQTINRRASLGMIAGLVTASRARAADVAPATIRLAAVSAGYGKPFGLAVIGIVQARKMIEDELRDANVRVTWTFPDGAGPAINEGIAGGQIDFAAYGDLPNIIGRAGGLPTRIIASRGAEIIYVGVRKGRQGEHDRRPQRTARHLAAWHDSAPSVRSALGRERLKRKRRSALRFEDAGPESGHHRR